MKSGFIIVLVTAPRDKGEEIARKILNERLAACVNILNVNSFYWWENEIVEDEEVLLIMKTRGDLYKKLEEFVKSIHPYEVPEILAVDIVSGNQDYLEWVAREAYSKN